MHETEITFRKLKAEDIPLLRQWFKEPHVAEFWEEPTSETELRDKYLRQLKARDVRSYIIYLGSEPIGYIQEYEACLLSGGWWPDAQPGTFGMDQFIGRPDLINKGIGTRVIRFFTEVLFTNPDVLEIIADPSPKNERAIRAYEKAGFKHMGPVTTPGGEALLMKLIRP